MGRYQPTVGERAAIDVLTLAGYTVVRASTYAALKEKVQLRDHQLAWEQDHRASTEAWARREFEETRRIGDRLTDVVAAAAAQGVTITAINAALHPKETPDV